MSLTLVGKLFAIVPPRKLKLCYKVIVIRNKNLGFSGVSDGKEFTCNVGNSGVIPGLERSPREGNETLTTSRSKQQQTKQGKH